MLVRRSPVSPRLRRYLCSDDAIREESYCDCSVMQMMQWRNGQASEKTEWPLPFSLWCRMSCAIPVSHNCAFVAVHCTVDWWLTEFSSIFTY
jgi:hypothetical protein